MTLSKHSSAFEIMRGAFDRAVDTARAEVCLTRHLPPPPKGRTLVVAAGKAAAAMAQIVDRDWPKGAELSGLAITRHGHGVPVSRIDVVEAGHPLPDGHGLAAARRALEEAAALGADDLLLCLLSGGGSALLTVPASGLELAHKQSITSQLLRSGASITEINCVRKHLSAIKGGRLAVAAAPARVETLIISDVAGNDPAVIASGPTVADPTSTGDALAIIKNYGLAASPEILVHLETEHAESPKPGDPAFANSVTTVVATADDALAAAADAVTNDGYPPIVLGDVEGDATLVAREHAMLAQNALKAGRKTAILSGGELTVTMTGSGRGGPNQEYLLALALELKSTPGVWALACDTDGIDGSQDNAGAWIDPGLLARARDKGLDAGALLRDNNSYEFFRGVGHLIETGPTYTNVNDFRILLIDPDA